MNALHMADHVADIKKEINEKPTPAENKMANVDFCHFVFEQETLAPFLNQFGLVTSLDYLAAICEMGSNLMIERHIKIDEKCIDEKLRLALYRIVQEQFNNTLKHADARTVELKLANEGNKILLQIQDDGVGFDTASKSKGVGLININTLTSLFNGKMIIDSSPGNGCALTIYIN